MAVIHAPEYSCWGEGICPRQGRWQRRLQNTECRIRSQLGQNNEMQSEKEVLIWRNFWFSAKLLSTTYSLRTFEQKSTTRKRKKSLWALNLCSLSFFEQLLFSQTNRITLNLPCSSCISGCWSKNFFFSEICFELHLHDAENEMHTATQSILLCQGSARFR